MAREIVWTAGAERDLLEIHNWLLAASGQDDQLLDSLLERPLQSALNLLQQQPQAGARVRGTTAVRRWLLGPQRRYGLFYVVEKRGLIVHALLDLRQDSETIRKRLPGL